MVSLFHVFYLCYLKFRSCHQQLFHDEWLVISFILVSPLRTQFYKLVLPKTTTIYAFLLMHYYNDYFQHS